MLDKAYDPSSVEDRIYKMWEGVGAFTADAKSGKEPFTVSMPPPNATGQLHLGHAVMLALEDIFVRFARMRGKEALWVPGTDHAAIATEAVVIKNLQKEGMRDPRKQLGREKLIQKISEFVEESKSTIRGQVRKMGSSCDWSREAYTMEPALNRCVNEVFAKMYADELIYRGHRIVNWDPKMQTTVSDDEIVYEERKEAFYTFKYGPFEISTARPETKFGDKYVVMHPDDKRYKKYKHGDTFTAEWINGPVTATIIKDKAVDPEFGTGVMTITPWHDHTDFEIAERHDLEKEQIIGFDGKLLPIAGEFEGTSIAEARPKIVEKLKEKGLLVSIKDDYVHNVSLSQRGKGMIEPQIKEQWFIDVNKRVVHWKRKQMSLKEVMQEVVKTGLIKIIPDRFEKTYFHWIDNLRDWCISRQIWWGHRVPVWYRKEGNSIDQHVGHVPPGGPGQRLIFARHGESVDNRDNVIQSESAMLTPEGENHARQLAKALKGRKITKIISSRTARALQTAEIAAETLDADVEIWDDLNAPDFGDLVGELEIPGTPPFERAIAAKTGESLNDYFLRAQRVWNKLRQERSEGDILVVSHRTNFSAIEAVMSGGKPEDVLKNRRLNDSAPFGVWREITIPAEDGALGWEQDSDTLDTWFSSAMWTWSTLVDKDLAADPDLTLEQILLRSPDFRAFHPTDVMETGYDILFFWVARMILMTTYVTGPIAELEYGQVPFDTVYLHGLIRTRDGRKMSKSDPETMIDPLDMISKYGADALRMSMIVGQSPGADSRLFEEKIAGYRNFVNKLWNASRFVLLECEKAGIDPKDVAVHDEEYGKLSVADRALLSGLQSLIEDVTTGLTEYRLSEVGERLYSFVWEFFCDWYLELSKGSEKNLSMLIDALRTIVQLLHPYCPFITEELWSQIKHKDAGLLLKHPWPEARGNLSDPEAEAELKIVIDIITAIRRLRTEQEVEPGKEVTVTVIAKNAALLETQEEHIRRLGKVKSLTFSGKATGLKNTVSAVIDGAEVHLSLEGLIDVEAEKKKLTAEKADLEKYAGSIEGKLKNKAFVERAPAELVASEKEKLVATKEKMLKIEARLETLGQ